MKITRIHIDTFGGLKNFEFKPGGGLTVIEGANEAGKSSIANFIKFIFFGLAAKGRDGAVSERAKWISWEDGRAAGFIELVYDGKNFRIERSAVLGGRSSLRESVRVLDIVSGEEVGLTPEEICGMPEELYLRTAFVRQADGRLFDGGDIGDAINNLLFSADENMGVDKAIKKLDEARVALLHKNKKGGMIYELECEREELSVALAASSEDNAELIAKEASLSDLRAKSEAGRARLGEVREILARYENGMLGRAARRLGEIKTKAAQLGHREDELRQKLSHNGFLPDDSYLRALALSASSVEAAEARAGELAGELERISASASGREDAKKWAETIRSGGGRTAISESILSSRGRAGTMRAFGVILALLAVVCIAGFAILLKLTGVELAMISAVGALAFGFGAVVCFIASSRASGEVRRTLEAFGAADLDELEDALEAATDEEARLRLLAERESEAAERLSSAQDEIEARRGELAALLSRWGRSLIGEARACVASVEREAEAALDTIAGASREREKYEASAEALRGQLSQYSPDELQERISCGMSEEELDAVDAKALEREREFLEKAGDAQAVRLTELERRVSALRATVKAPAETADRISAIDARIARLKKRHDAYVMAISALEVAGDRLRETVAPRLACEAGKYMALITGGKYSSLGVSSSLELSVTGEDVRSVELLSSGTRDASYISLRIALLRLIGGEELPTLILDESFARLDDARLGRMLSLLSSASDIGIQSMVLTAQSRDGSLAPEGCTVVRL